MPPTFVPPEAKRFISRYAAFLTDRTDGPSPSLVYGVYHRLSGAVFGISDDLLALLQMMRAEHQAWPSLEMAADAQAIAQELALHELLVTEPDRPLLGMTRGATLFVPRRHPAVIVRLADSLLQVTIPRDLNLCRLPRTSQQTEAAVEYFEGVEAELLEAACQPQGCTDWSARFEGREAQVAEALDVLTHPELQLVRLSRFGLPAPESPSHIIVQSFRRSAMPASRGPGALTDARDFYRHYLVDGQVNFDWVEPTVSHAFRRPTEALGGQSFGQRLGHFFVRRSGSDLRTSARPFRVLEIGAGLGLVARSLAPILVEAFTDRRLIYTLLDISPHLLEQQRRTLADLDIEFEFVVGEAQCSLPEDVTFDLVLANEVIADFELTQRESGGPLRQSGLGGLLDGLSHIAAPGALVFLSEYGSRDAPPRQVAHLNHPEFTIDFGDLANQARKVGFDVEILSLDEVLGFDGSARLLVGQQEGYACLNAMLEARGLERLEYRTYDEIEFEQTVLRRCLPAQLLWPHCAPARFGLHFGPEIDSFLCAVLTKPVRTIVVEEDGWGTQARDACARVLRAIDAGVKTACLLEIAMREAQLCEKLLESLPTDGVAQRIVILGVLKSFTFQAAAHACPALDQTLELSPDNPTFRRALALAHRSRLATMELGHGDVAVANVTWLTGVLHLCVDEFAHALHWLEVAERRYRDAGEWLSASFTGAYVCLARGDSDVGTGGQDWQPRCDGAGEQVVLTQGLERLRHYVLGRHTLASRATGANS